MHHAPKQIPVNARVNLRNDPTNGQIAQAIGEIEAKIKEAEPKIDMIFLKTSTLDNSLVKETMPKHIG